ncbi:DUF3892 domain-containing protein [Levilactobacillus brevis]|uniref:DUF3892 domain-containing protein n=1 Tax=Levilactobacillus brevis TaxID=1580 RepID=A0A2A3TWX4_LEVBR|nr:DUF3892 domain-containing protein [Levilactobacillus brevis]ARW21859.1 hypothetical protein S101174_01017 [Levilactobacillus brevis]PBQ23415.1 DUF3892 domain-containing protein [Levilactobacillus brevis]
MEFEIVKVHTTTYFESNESDIQKVRLSDGSDELVEQVVRYIDNNFEYYFTSREGLKTKVETVHPSYSDPYIRTKANQITSDNLLSLPRF